jgi:hypothetical protein
MAEQLPVDMNTRVDAGHRLSRGEGLLALTRKRRNLDRPAAQDLDLRRAGFASSASRAR